MKGIASIVLTLLFVEVAVCFITPGTIKKMVAETLEAISENELAINDVRTHAFDVQRKILTAKAGINLMVLSADKNIAKIIVNLQEDIAKTGAEAGKVPEKCDTLQRAEVKELSRGSMAEVVKCRTRTLPETDKLQVESNKQRSELMVLEIENTKTISGCLGQHFVHVDDLQKCFDDHLAKTKSQLAEIDAEVTETEKKIDGSHVVSDTRLCVGSALADTQTGADQVLDDFTKCLDE